MSLYTTNISRPKCFNYFCEQHLLRILKHFNTENFTRKLVLIQNIYEL